MKKLRAATAAAAFAALALLTAAGAQATTFCVPTLAACPNGTGVATTDLEEAMGTSGSDGQADTVHVAAGSFSEDAGFEPGAGSSATTFEVKGTDPLSVVGAGIGATTMTSNGSSNAFVVNLSYNNGRAVTLRDLAIELPASFPDGLGAGILLYQGDALEDVAVISFNEGSNAIKARGTGNSIRGGVIRGGGLEGSVGDAIGVESGETVVEDVDIEGASWGLVTSSGADAHLVARRVHETGTRTYGAIATSGTMRLENSLLEIDDGIGLYVGAATTDTLLDADQITVVNSGSGDPAIEGKKFGSSAGDATMVVSSSIFRGFSSGYKTETAFGPGIGLVSLTARYSNLPPNGASSGGTADLGTGNIDVDPLFAADFSLPASSPSIDAGDPGAGGLAIDILGAPRPNDGDGDGVAVRDQGAFEYQRPAAPGGGGVGAGGGGGSGAAGDKAPPQTTIVKGPGSKLAQAKAKFAFRASEAGSTFTCKLDKRKASRCRSPRRYTGLEPGRHLFKVWATDKAGNKDPSPAKRRFGIPA
jgi:hypothetical protein